MATGKMQYKNLNHALQLFRGQVSDSLNYAKHDVPPLDSPEKIFDWLKLRTKYKNDPKNTELFQTLPTLLENNFHGITGAGDCDCFTIAALATLLANGFYDCGICLVGRNRFTPVHIYAYVIVDGQKTYLDLTNKYYNQTRFYPYIQDIPFKINAKEKKDMMLQLADMGDPLMKRRPRKPRPTQAQIEKYKQSSGYKRRRAAHDKMMFEKRKQQGMVKRLNPNHIWIPSRGVQIREDYFDNTMHDGEFQNMLLSEGYEPQEIAELAGRRGDRRRARKDEKRALKKEKKMSKVELRRAKAEKKKATGEAKRIKAQAKQDKANRGGGDGEDDDSTEGVIGKYFNKAVGGVSKVMNAYRGVKGEIEGEEPQTASVDDTEATPTGTNAIVRKMQPQTLPSEPKTVTIFGKQMSQTTAILGGLGIAAVVVGGGIAISKSRKNKRLAA